MAKEEKTEQPTPRKRRKAREEGKVATSVDLSRAIALLLILVAWRFAGPGMLSRLLDMTEHWLRTAGPGELPPEVVMSAYVGLMPIVAAVLAPVMLAAIVGTIIAASAQTKGLLAVSAVKPDWSRINPINGFKRIFSTRGAVTTIKNILKIMVVLFVAVWVLRARADSVMLMGALELRPAMSLMVGIAGEIIVKCTLTLLAIGAADYGYEWWDHEKQLRMSRHELKRDLRESDGDPQIRARRDEMRREVRARGISAQMPQADVVVTNPTHYAVALRYDPEEMEAPGIVASGQRAVAREIIRLARHHGIMIVENPPVARSLFDSCRLGDAVPEKLYDVIAEIFAAVYRRRAKIAERSRGNRRQGANEKGRTGS